MFVRGEMRVLELIEMPINYDIVEVRFQQGLIPPGVLISVQFIEDHQSLSAVSSDYGVTLLVEIKKCCVIVFTVIL
jgi:hypothetical protein